MPTSSFRVTRLPNNSDGDQRANICSREALPLSIAPLPPDRRAARIAIVEHHLRLENEHNLEGVLATFGDSARYDDEPWNEHYTGAAGVRQFYEQLMRAIPDLVIDVQRQHITDDAILVEVIIRGTHQGAWRGLPATGRHIEFPLCGIYTFDSNDRLAGEKIYQGWTINLSGCDKRCAMRNGATVELVATPSGYNLKLDGVPLRSGCSSEAAIDLAVSSLSGEARPESEL